MFKYLSDGDGTPRGFPAKMEGVAAGGASGAKGLSLRVIRLIRRFFLFFFFFTGTCFWWVEEEEERNLYLKKMEEGKYSFYVE